MTDWESDWLTDWLIFLLPWLSSVPKQFITIPSIQKKTIKDLILNTIYETIYTIYETNQSAKLCVIRALVPSASCTLPAVVCHMSRVLRAFVRYVLKPLVFPSSLSFMPQVPRTSYVLSCFTYFMPYVLSYFTCHTLIYPCACCTSRALSVKCLTYFHASNAM